jgi:hypothetical protein
VEIVGPAGAGKTALLRTLSREPHIRAGVRINRARYFLDLVGHAVVLLPPALELLRQGPASLWSGMLHLVRLRTLPSVVAIAMADDAGRVVLLDEGPMFSLGRLSVFQHANHGTSPLARQWRSELDRWTTLLDAVVWVDAADPVLIERIRTRRKSHRVKSGTSGEVVGFLDRYRQAYGEVLSALRASGRVRVIEINTTTVPIDTAASRVLAELERLAPPGPG